MKRISFVKICSPAFILMLSLFTMSAMAAEICDKYRGDTRSSFKVPERGDNVTYVKYVMPSNTVNLVGLRGPDSFIVFGNDLANKIDLAGIEKPLIICGGGGIDSIFGGNGDDYINGEGGHDWIQGGPGDDTLQGGSNDDWIFGGDGVDQMWGSSGDDRLFQGEYWPNPNTLEAQYFPNEFTEFGTLISVMRGGTGDDVLYGSNSANKMYGNSGNDKIRGYGGNDYLSGHTGDDTIWGSFGSDTIKGGDGHDTCFSSSSDKEVSSCEQ